MDDPNNATNVKVLRGEIATMDEQFEGFLTQLQLRDEKNPNQTLKLTPEETERLKSNIRAAFNDMTLDKRRAFFAMTPEARDKWMNGAR